MVIACAVDVVLVSTAFKSVVKLFLLILEKRLIMKSTLQDRMNSAQNKTVSLSKSTKHISRECAESIFARGGKVYIKEGKIIVEKKTNRI